MSRAGDQVTDADAIAIVGMSCRFPGADSLAGFWDNLLHQRESITRLSTADLIAAGVDRELLADPDYVPAAPLITGADMFDAQFFGYTPREAQIRDPQSRLFLEHCYTALEDSGHDPQAPPGQVGVFGGMANNLYGEHHVARNTEVSAAVGQMAIEVANSPDYLCANVSYRLGFNGPSVNVQAACSTALVAVHLACQSLRSGECDLALAGAVEVELPYGTGYLWAEGSIYSRDGHVRPFSDSADGTVFGTGVGVVLLRRLDEALADGDAIYGIVRGSAVNNDGSDRAGFTAPGVHGQAMLIREALADAAVDAGSIGFVEAHATGTLVGDPIEMEALKRAFISAGYTRAGTVAVGSVKSNVGHLGPAAGMAGLAKVCLAMQHGTIPPTINVGRVNPRLGLDGSPFYIPVEAVPWPAGTRRAGISSFGIGGTNAHLIVEEPPRRPRQPAARHGPAVLPLSARTPTALAQVRTRLADHLAGDAGADLDSVAWTLQDGRAAFGYRATVVAEDLDEAVKRLREEPATPDRPVGQVEGVVLLMPGQGSQFPGMGRDLWNLAPAFADVVERCCETVRALADVDLLPLLVDPAADPDLINQTWVTQPLLFTMEVGVAAALASWGVAPRAHLGHSIGELAAAHLSGVLDLDDALRLVCARGGLLHACPPGAMLAVAADWPDVEPLIAGEVDLAAVNGPRAITVSGGVDAVERVATLLDRLDVTTFRLPTSRAFHSRLVDGAAGELAEVARSLTWHPPRIPFVSGTTGEWMTTEQCADPAYWARQLREPVHFHAGLTTVLSGGEPVLVEAGPGGALSGFAAATRPGSRTVLVASRNPTGAGSLLADLWSAGVTVDWRATWRTTPARTHLPTYSFERSRHWVEPDPVQPSEAGNRRPTGLRTLDDGAVALPLWRQTTPTIGSLPSGPWLVLVENTGHGRALVSALSAVTDVVAVTAGSLHTSTVPDGPPTTWWTADPSSRDDLATVLRAFVDRAGTDHVNIVAAPALTAPGDPDPDPLAGMARSANELFDTLLALSQAIAAMPEIPSNLVVVTASLDDVGRSTTTSPAQAVALGPVLLLPREASHARARLVDVELGGDQAEPDWCAELVAELACPDPEPHVALRDRRRYAIEYRASGLPEPVRPETYREGATYLVTGGLGGIGLEVAQHLGEQAPVDLVLVARRAFPPREVWADALQAPQTPERDRHLLQRLAAIESGGTRVTVERCDIAEDAQVRALAERLSARGARVAGILHCAGIAGGGMLAARSAEAAREVLAPKVRGTVNLYRHFGPDLELLVLFSSITAVTGAFGMVDYCAANNFLDAFATWSRTQGTRTVSIGWGGWSQVGMVEKLNAAAPAAYRALQDGADVTPGAHPLLDRVRTRTASRVVAETDLWPGRHWVSADHVVRGQEVLVGTALIEIVRACQAETIGGEAHLESIAHLAAIAVTGQHTLRTTLTRDSEPTEAWRVTVEVSDADTATRQWTPALAAILVPEPGIASRRADLEHLRNAHPETVAHEVLRRPSALIRYGDRWRSIVSTVCTGSSEVVELELPAHVRDDAAQFVLHPALLDSAVADAQHNPTINARGETYLPLSYDKLTWTGRLPNRLWSHVRHLDDRSGEVTTADIDIYDDEGWLVAEVRGFAMRRVDRDRFSQDLGKPAHAPAGPPAPPIAPRVHDGAAWRAIDPGMGIEALRRILAWDPAPHVIVTPEGIDEALRSSATFDLGFVEDNLNELRLSDHTGQETVPDGTYERPATAREHQLAELWSNVLGVERVGRYDSFFDLGGNSLVAVQLVARIRSALGLRMGIALLFDHPTLDSLAGALDAIEDASSRDALAAGAP